MSNEKNKELVQRGYALFKTGDIAGILDLCADDIVWSSMDSEYVPYSGTYTGKQGVAQFFSKLNQAVEFEQFEPTTFIVDTEQVAVAGASKSTVRSTGVPVENRWVHVFSIRDGKIARFEQYDDSAAIVDAFTATEKDEVHERRAHH